MYTCIYACGKYCELVESAGHGGGGYVLHHSWKKQAYLY